MELQVSFCVLFAVRRSWWRGWVNSLFCLQWEEAGDVVEAAVQNAVPGGRVLPGVELRRSHR